jgi:hypothetical protein
MLETGENFAIDMMLAASLSTLYRIAGTNMSMSLIIRNIIMSAVTIAGKIAVNTKMKTMNAEMPDLTSVEMIIMGIIGMKARATVKAIVTMVTVRIKVMTKTTRYPLYTYC